MNTTQLIEEREPDWKALDELTVKMSKRLTFRRGEAATVTRFVTLYRQVCSDLALAKSYHFPPDTVAYLNSLVGRAHNQLYRTRQASWHGLFALYFVELPARLVADPVFWLAMILFWLPFFVCGTRAAVDRQFALDVVGEGTTVQLREMYSKSFDDVDVSQRTQMVAFYIRNNAGIGLRCFAYGIFGGFGCLYVLFYNAVFLGATYGYMLGLADKSPEITAHFMEFVTAHGPFELSAIVLSATGGMKMGFAFIWTGGYTRFDSVRRSAHAALPILAVAVCLFCLAAVLEALLSPNPFFPVEVKRLVAILSSVLLVVYIFVLGFSGRARMKRGTDLTSDGAEP